jgi:type III secretory pathway lipoprotein EscJ
VLPNFASYNRSSSQTIQKERPKNTNTMVKHISSTIAFSDANNFQKQICRIRPLIKMRIPALVYLNLYR